MNIENRLILRDSIIVLLRGREHGFRMGTRSLLLDFIDSQVVESTIQSILNHRGVVQACGYWNFILLNAHMVHFNPSQRKVGIL